jgi:hypothetical protein
MVPVVLINDNRPVNTLGVLRAGIEWDEGI